MSKMFIRTRIDLSPLVACFGNGAHHLLADANMNWFAIYRLQRGITAIYSLLTLFIPLYGRLVSKTFIFAEKTLTSEFISTMPCLTA